MTLPIAYIGLLERWVLSELTRLYRAYETGTMDEYLVGRAGTVAQTVVEFFGSAEMAFGVLLFVAVVVAVFGASIPYLLQWVTDR